MPSTKAYLAGLVALTVVLTVAAAAFAVLYKTYEDAYEKLLDRHKKLLDEVEKFAERHAKILFWLGTNFGTSELLPGYYLAIPIVIPIDDVGIVDVTVISKQGSVKVYIFDKNQFAEWCARKSISSYYLYAEGSYIERKVTLRPELYFVVIINPNITPTSISYRVITRYKSLLDKTQSS
ncbi:MAG: hypothetical protein ACO2PN_21350 [Pyrobaculum sp.]|jgi:hypothetical protein